jgi:cyclic lactone autoinducer peptide
MARMRKPFQGVWNIVRFNWHFYVFAFLAIVLFICLGCILPSPFRILGLIASLAIFITTLVSIMASWYVYDQTKLYDLNWLDENEFRNELNILNINAGFDETSEILESKFTYSKLTVYDFYDPSLHTEVSVKRARVAYPPHPVTQSVATKNLPGQSNSFDKIFCFLSAHEIRNEQERIVFFQELHRILKDDGQVYVVEHLRDINNFLAYTIGFFHFHSFRMWERTFEESGLRLSTERKLNPLITLFIITKNGITP